MALSDLQIVLIGAGAAAVAAVWAYNLWQERKLRRLTETLFTHPQSDTLINTPIAERSTDQEETYDLRDIVERKEPTSSSSHEDAVDVIEPSKENAPGEFSEQIHDASAGKIAEELPKESIDEWPQASIPEPGALPSDWADTLTQCVLRLKTTEPIPATTLWMLQTRWAEQLDKPLYWMAYDSSAASWLKINETATGRHMHWIVALQLADRRGAVSENTLVHFFDGMEQLANHVGADLPLPDPAPIVDHAAALDTFCANVDIQFKVHIVESAGGVFSGTKLRGVAEAAGMQLEEDGCFHARDSAGEELFTLMNLGSEAFTLENLRSLATHGLSLSLDVPRVGDGLATFTRMLATGQQLARALDGVLVDAQRVPLTDVMTSAIRAKITELQQTMREADIVPGSTRAHRLFS